MKKANTDKFQFMVLGNKSYKQFKLTINGSSINSQKSVKLLGITIDSKLNFNTHIGKIYATWLPIRFLHYKGLENT